MQWREWGKLPDFLQLQEVKPYYERLSAKRSTLLAKRLFDFVVAVGLLVGLAPLFIIIAVAVKGSSIGPVFFRQKRVTQYGRVFIIFKFRTMVQNAETLGSSVTRDKDPRVTRCGHFLRKTRLDELPQLINILRGEMSFVGTRPEIPKYVEHYSGEMMATLLLPAGVTSPASIAFKNEAMLLNGTEDVDTAYVKKVLPQKMNYNLNYMKEFDFFEDIKVMLFTLRSLMR